MCYFPFVSISLQLKAGKSPCFSLRPPLAVAIRRDSTRLRPVSGGLAVQGCRDCVGSPAPQLAFFHLSACLSAQMTDGCELRASGGPQKASCQSVTHNRRRRCKSCGNRGWLLITWRGGFLFTSGFFSVCIVLFFPLKQISCSIPPVWQKFLLSFAYSVQTSDCPRRLQTEG